MDIGIIFAMHEECNAFLNLFQTYKQTEIGGLTAYELNHQSHHITAMLSGIGKVNAARATTILLKHCDVDVLLNSGVAGGIQTEKNTIILSTKVVHHDVDVRAFGRNVKGQVPGLEPAFIAEHALLKLAETIAIANQLPYKLGMIASGDAFITDFGPIQDILDVYTDIYAVEMEAAAIAQVATLENVPFLIIRSISDVIGTPSQSEEFETFLSIAAKQSATLLFHMVEAL